jgi:hypothetical protein
MHAPLIYRNMQNRLSASDLVAPQTKTEQTPKMMTSSSMMEQKCNFSLI